MVAVVTACVAKSNATSSPFGPQQIGAVKHSTSAVENPHTAEWSTDAEVYIVAYGPRGTGLARAELLVVVARRAAAGMR